MMAIDEAKRKASTIIVSLGGPEKMSGVSSEESEEMMEEFSMVAEEILSAIEQKDSKEFAMALKNFIQMCEYYE